MFPRRHLTRSLRTRNHPGCQEYGINPAPCNRPLSTSFRIGREQTRLIVRMLAESYLAGIAQAAAVTPRRFGGVKRAVYLA